MKITPQAEEIIEELSGEIWVSKGISQFDVIKIINEALTNSELLKAQGLIQRKETGAACEPCNRQGVRHCGNPEECRVWTPIFEKLYTEEEVREKILKAASDAWDQSRKTTIDEITTIAMKEPQYAEYLSSLFPNK